MYKRRYIDGERLPPGIALIRGGAVHEANEASMVAKMDGGGLGVEEVKDRAADAFEDRVGRGFVLDGAYGKGEFTPKQALAHAKDDAVHLSALHLERVAPTIIPTAVEVRIEIPPSESLPVTFVSILDLIDRDQSPVDTKTKSKAPNADEADLSEQLSGQALAFRARKQYAERSLRLDILTRTPKTRKVNYIPLETTRTTADLEIFLRRANAALSVIEAERFIPPLPDSWWCAPLWCGYYETCPYARGRARPKS
jgi:hypothetical protein